MTGCFDNPFGSKWDRSDESNMIKRTRCGLWIPRIGQTVLKELQDDARSTQGDWIHRLLNEVSFVA